MKETRLTFPELALIAGTRVAAGAGLGLLLSNRLSESQRRAAGWALLLVGALSTVPLALEVLGRRCPPAPTDAGRSENTLRSEVEAQLDQPSVLSET